MTSAFKLARWFQPERYANRPEDDYVRDEILNDLADANAVGLDTADGNATVFVRTPNGACAIETDTSRGLVFFDYVSDVRWERTAFWMNASSVRDLGRTLHAAPRVPVSEIFTGVPA